MANIVITETTPNVTVNSSNNTVTVTNDTSNIVVSNIAVADIDQVLLALSVNDTGGDGSLSYNNTSGVFTYTGPSASEVRAHISNTDPVLYNSSTGVVSLNNTTLLSGQTTANLSENTNLYYTNERVRDTIANTLVAGANITITNDDANNTTTIAADLTGDIDSVVAGSGLTGGGSSGDVTLNVGSGYGITVNADSIELTNSEVQAQANVALGNNTTDNLSEGSTNLYYTNARANAAFVDSLDNITTAISSNANITTTANIQGAVIKGTSIAISGDSSITGNLNVTGNINSETVTDLFVEDRNITLQFGATGTPSANSQIFVDRGSESNSYIKWDENGDAWKFSNDGSTEYKIPASTSDLAEGTNLYYTQARFDTAFSGKSTTNLSEGTNLYFTNARANAAFVDSLDNITTALSSNANITTTANVAGANFIGNVTGNVTGSPSSLAGLDTDDLSEGSSNLYFTTARANSAIGAYTGNLTAVNTTGNITTTANASVNTLLTDNIESGSGANVNIKGQANGIHFNKTITSTESRIFDVDTEGYGVKDADVGTNFDNVSFKSLMCQLSATAGGNTATISPLFGGAFGTTVFLGRQTSATAFTSSFGLGATAEAALTNATGSGGAGGNAKGWTVYVLADASSTTSLPKESFMTSISGNVATFSENFTQNISAGAGGFSALLVPGAASTTQNLAFSIDTDSSNTSIPFVSIRPRYSEYDLPQTLSNVTLDAISYNTSGGASTVDLANVVTRNMAEIKTNPGSGFRLTDGSLLIGNSLTPDVSTIGQNTLQPSKASLQGIASELDGKTTYTVDNAPMNKLNMYNFTDNSIPTLAAAAGNTLPTWTTFLGQSGNNIVDARQIGAPTIDMRLNGGNSSNRSVSSLAIGSNVAIGKINFGGRSLDLTAVDPFYAPTSISVFTAKDRAVTDNVASADFYLTNTHKTSYRNGTDVSAGGIPSTFIANQAGNTIIAAKADGTVSLRPQRDYGADGTTGNATYTQNRFPDELHEFHSFLNAGYLGTKTGTLVEIQPKSGQTFDNTSGFNYDSKGDATLRLTTHEANSSVKAKWDIRNEQSSSNLVIAKDGADIVDITASEITSTIPIAFDPATSTSASIAFTKPTIHGNATTALTADITNDLTNAKLGIVQKIYHNHSSAPSVPGGWVKVGENDYITGTRNIIYAEFAEGTRVEYWIVHEAS